MPFWMCFMKSELIFKIRDCYYLKFVCVGVLDMVLSMSLFFSSTPNFDSYRHIYNSPIGRLHLLDRLIFEYSKYDGFRWARNRNRTDKIYTYYIFEGSSWASHEFFCLLGMRWPYYSRNKLNARPFLPAINRVCKKENWVVLI